MLSDGSQTVMQCPLSLFGNSLQARFDSLTALPYQDDDSSFQSRCLYVQLVSGGAFGHLRRRRGLGDVGQPFAIRDRVRNRRIVDGRAFQGGEDRCRGLAGRGTLASAAAV